MNNTKRITSLILVCVLCLSVSILFAACQKAPEELPETSVTETTKRKKPKPTTEVTIEDPTEDPTKPTAQPTTKAPTTTKAPSTTRTPPTTKASSTTRTPSTTKPPATTRAPSTTQPSTQKPAQPTTQKPKPTEPTTEKPVTTTKQDVSKAYSCGSSRHHCKTPGDHAFISSLEAKGCPICGSHSCKSFYCTDQWGNPSYNQKKCPQYGVKDDPLVYCSTCGKKVGTGDKGTCVRFTVDTVCPICHKEVTARTCHSH